MIKLDFYKNKTTGKTNSGKVYARANNNEPIDIKGLAKHIADHGSQYTYDIILGVLAKIASCVRHLVLDGTPVKIDDLCIFTPAVSVLPADDVESFSLSKATRAADGTYDSSNGNVRCVRMMMRATGEATQLRMTQDASLGYTSLAQKIKIGEAVLSDKKGEYLATSAGGGDGWGDEPLNP